MRVFRVIALIGFIAFFVGFVAPDHAVAGEKFKVRIVKHNTKWHPIAVPCEGGKVVGSFEEKGVSTNMGGKGHLGGMGGYRGGALGGELQDRRRIGLWIFRINRPGWGQDLSAMGRKESPGRSPVRRYNNYSKRNRKWEGIQGREPGSPLR